MSRWQVLLSVRLDGSSLRIPGWVDVSAEQAAMAMTLGYKVRLV